MGGGNMPFGDMIGLQNGNRQYDSRQMSFGNMTVDKMAFAKMVGQYVGQVGNMTVDKLSFGQNDVI
jgi:hypothetical protein